MQQQILVKQPTETDELTDKVKGYKYHWSKIQKVYNKQHKSNYSVAELKQKYSDLKLLEMLVKSLPAAKIRNFCPFAKHLIVIEMKNPCEIDITIC